ncbi:Hypothetical predicted protein [Prunus dulcis]|uniref:Leucine-rich repeat-containing N-terminal plant-type domain-containing protein n=1 Tax=Prunus dulcis TaxID=3755 RepID=A0A5E4GDV4_PRUDU|nr:Hypothetical predicted protein [Prunus dulcis]
MRGNETDRLALLAVKAQIKQDPHNVLSSWNESIHFCSWHGVFCGRRHRQRVTRLDLQSQKLAGGPIPYNISYCSNLIFMNFGHNRLVGKIPSEFGSLSKLQNFVLKYNYLTGEIPPSLGNLSSLEVLAALRNNLVGSLPTSLGQLKKLTLLLLGLNKLTGTIPPSIYKLSALDGFAVEDNQIRGSLPSDLGNTLPNLQAFSIAGNQFFGSLPLSLSNATNLRIIQVQQNKLTGQVPDFRKLHDLERFIIQLNHLGVQMVT